MTTSDGTYEACLAYLNAKGHTLWGDFSLNPNEDGSGRYSNQAAASWLEAQVRGVAEHYDTAEHPAPPYAGPYSTERHGGGHRPQEDRTSPSGSRRPTGRPSALITHGQQAERW